MSGKLVLAAREVPPPAHLSDEAREFLMMTPASRTPFPTTNDSASWAAYIESRNAAFQDKFGPRLVEAMKRVQSNRLGDACVYIAEPHVDLQPGKVCLSIHGGAFMLQGGALVAYDAWRTSSQTGCLTFSVDYRMPPVHPYPAGLDDCLAAYVRLLADWPAQDIFIVGVSAGGNLAAAMVLRAIDEGLPTPAGLVLRTPEVDLTEPGDSFHTHIGLDNVLPTRLRPINLVYAADHPLGHPYLSPLNGTFTEAFPPTLVQSGTRDLFLSNSVRMHRRLRDAGVDAELHVWEAMPHAGFGGTSPEDQEVWAEIRRFMARIFNANSGSTANPLDR